MTWRGDQGMLGMRRRPLLEAMRAAGVGEPAFKRFGFLPRSSRIGRAGDAERRIESIAPLRPFLPFQLVGGRLGNASEARYR